MLFSDLESKQGDAGYLEIARVFLGGIGEGSFAVGEVPGSGQ